MKHSDPNVGNWLTNVLIGLLLLYLGKSALGINLIKDCHAEDVLFGNCTQPKKQILNVPVSR
jgi:hypothetical protein